MALQLGVLLDALLSAKVDSALAGKAAEASVGVESRLVRMNGRLTLLIWMVGGLYVVLVPWTLMLLRLSVKLGPL